MTSQSDIGRIGQNCVEAWAAQAHISANPSFNDERGWDAILQLPAADLSPSGPLDRSPPEVSCMVQIKTTTGTRHAEPIKLSNWQRMCKDPIPWFVVAIHLDENLQPASAYLVHVDEAWCATVFRRLRELGPDARATLHKHDIEVKWAEAQKLGELHGRELLRLIRRHVAPDQLDYVRRKRRWFDELGYEDKARKIKLSFSAKDDTTFFQQTADLAVGLRSTLPDEWHATVTDVRFGIEGTLKDFGPEAGEIEFRPRAQGVASLKALAVTGAVLGAAQCDVFRARSIFPFLPERFDMTRFVSAYVSCVVRAIEVGGVRGLSANFSFSIPGDEPVRLDAVRGPLGIVSAFAHRRVAPVTIRLSIGAGTFDLPLDSGEILGDVDAEYFETLDHSLTICDAFDLPGATEVMLDDLAAQAQAVRFVSEVLKGGAGRLQGPYGEPVTIGATFGVTAEVWIHLASQHLGCFVGAYGIVTACDVRPGVGAQITVDEGRTIIEKIVATSGIEEARFDTARARIVGRLQELGCTAVWDHAEAARRQLAASDVRAT
jgi:hypothetical protein